MPDVLLVGLTFAFCIYVLNLPFMIPVFTTPFFRERFYAYFHFKSMPICSPSGRMRFDAGPSVFDSYCSLDKLGKQDCLISEQLLPEFSPEVPDHIRFLSSLCNKISIKFEKNRFFLDRT